MARSQTFFSKFRTDAVGGTFQHVQVNGGANNQNDPGVEVRQLRRPEQRWVPDGLLLH